MPFEELTDPGGRGRRSAHRHSHKPARPQTGDAMATTKYSAGRGRENIVKSFRLKVAIGSQPESGVVHEQVLDARCVQISPRASEGARAWPWSTNTLDGVCPPLSIWLRAPPRWPCLRPRLLITPDIPASLPHHLPLPFLTSWLACRRTSFQSRCRAPVPLVRRLLGVQGRQK